MPNLIKRITLPPSTRNDSNIDYETLLYYLSKGRLVIWEPMICELRGWENEETLPAPEDRRIHDPTLLYYLLDIDDDFLDLQSKIDQLMFIDSKQTIILDQAFPPSLRTCAKFMRLSNIQTHDFFYKVRHVSQDGSFHITLIQISYDDVYQQYKLEFTTEYDDFSMTMSRLDFDPIVDDPRVVVAPRVTIDQIDQALVIMLQLLRQVSCINIYDDTGRIIIRTTLDASPLDNNLDLIDALSNRVCQFNQLRHGQGVLDNWSLAAYIVITSKQFIAIAKVPAFSTSIFDVFVRQGQYRRFDIQTLDRAMFAKYANFDYIMNRANKKKNLDMNRLNLTNIHRQDHIHQSLLVQKQIHDMIFNIQDDEYLPIYSESPKFVQSLVSLMASKKCIMVYTDGPVMERYQFYLVPNFVANCAGQVALMDWLHKNELTDSDIHHHRIAIMDIDLSHMTYNAEQITMISTGEVMHFRALYEWYRMSAYPLIQFPDQTHIQTIKYLIALVHYGAIVGQQYSFDAVFIKNRFDEEKEFEAPLIKEVSKLDYNDITDLKPTAFTAVWINSNVNRHKGKLYIVDRKGNYWQWDRDIRRFSLIYFDMMMDNIRLCTMREDHNLSTEARKGIERIKKTDCISLPQAILICCNQYHMSYQ